MYNPQEHSDVELNYSVQSEVALTFAELNDEEYKESDESQEEGEEELQRVKSRMMKVSPILIAAMRRDEERDAIKTHINELLKGVSYATVVEIKEGLDLIVPDNGKVPFLPDPFE